MGALAGGLSTMVINRNALAETVLTCGCFIGISMAHIYITGCMAPPICHTEVGPGTRPRKQALALIIQAQVVHI